jgi:acetoin utilization deacetylase AcuC-like enzyme
MNPAAVAWISHRECLRHEMGADHPECPRRLHVIEDRLRACGLDVFLRHYEAPAATTADLARVHDRDYIHGILSAHPGANLLHIDGDTAMNAHTGAAALRAAGAGLLAVDLVLGGHAAMAFAAVRPPGHHAERAQAMGFCFFNNVAVAATYALTRGVARAAILDFDVHFGNGTVQILGGHPHLLLCSLHQSRLYPHWRGEGAPSNLVDAPLSAGEGSAALHLAVTDRWLSALEAFEPELLLVSAGFDAHAQDPMSDLRFGFDDYEWIGTVIERFAAQHCGGRVVAMLEGGYNLDILGPSVESFLRPFVGVPRQ